MEMIKYILKNFQRKYFGGLMRKGQTYKNSNFDKRAFKKL